MRTLFFFFIILMGLFANAQVKIPAEVAKRLQSDKSFSSYAREMTRYIKTKQSQYTADSKERTFYDKQEKYLARSLWYLEGRQNADGTIQNYSKQTYEAIQRYQSQVAPNASATGAWSLVGPTNNLMGSENTTGIGRADRIAFHPTNPNTIFVGTPAAGIFKSVNGGDSWTNLNSFIPSLGISGLVVSWSDPDVIYALTGDGDSNLGENGFVQGFDYIRPSIGVLKSTDGGTSWQQTGTLYNTDSFYVGYKLVQHPANANILLAATSRGLYRTTNGGNTWTRVSHAENRFYDIEWKPGSSTRVYAASADTFYISNDAGASFVNQNNNFNIPWDSCTRIALSVTPANPNYLYVMAAFINYQNTIVNKGVFRSTNSGDNLFQTSTLYGLTDGLPQYMFNITTASNNASIVLTGALNIYRSTNGAAAFSGSNSSGDAASPNYVHVDIHDLAYNPLDNALYVACDGGVYKSTDHGVTYATKYVGFTASQFYHFDISTADEDYMFAGAQDNGGMLRQGNTLAFSKMISGDGYDTKFDNGSTTLAWISVNTNLYRSNATMTSFTGESGTGGGWFKRIAMNYSNSNYVFVSSGAVYRTLTAGGSWSNRGANGRWALTTCPSNGNRIYAAGGASWNSEEDDDDRGSDKRLFRSDDLADTWVQLTTKPGMPATITKITCIEVSPSNSSQVWITMGGFTDGQKVYYSIDAGEHWTNISGSIPNFPVNCIAIDANEDAYIGTDAGVFYKSISMNDWQPFYNFLPQVPVTELHIRNGNIYASTFGRGIWVSDTRGPCPANINFTSPVSGIKFYEAITFTASSTLRGGAGNQLFLRAQSNIVLSPGFRADGSTGEKFRAWIGSCGSGGIPQFHDGEITEWINTHSNDQLTLSNTNDSSMISINMPFDGKARLFLLDKEQQIKEVLLADKSLQSGKSSLHIDDKIDWANRTLVLMIDGKMAGVIKQKSK